MNEALFLQVLSAIELQLLRFALHLTRQRADAEELIQETVLRAWKWVADARQMDKVIEREHLENWLFTVLFNLITSHWRKKRPRLSSESLLTAIADRMQSPEKQAEIKEQSARVRQAVLRLPRPMREVIFRVYYTGLSQEEIAQDLAIPKTTVNTRLSHARVKLRKNLGDS